MGDHEVQIRYRDAREVDLDRPCAARIHNAFLGGSYNFAVEREFIERAEQKIPTLAEGFVESRAFLRRSVDVLLEQGIRQFLDLGSGIPTIGHVHEVVHARDVPARVLYVDNEPLTVSHSKGLLADVPGTEIIRADIRDPGSILDSPEAHDLFDLAEPVALVANATIQLLPDSDHPDTVLGAYRDAVVPGSYLLLSHLTGAAEPEQMRTLQTLYTETSDPVYPRSTERIEALFGAFELLPPGAGFLADWRPDVDGLPRQRPYLRVLYGGLGRKA